jgi:hypothetical protein
MSVIHIPSPFVMIDSKKNNFLKDAGSSVETTVNKKVIG